MAQTIALPQPDKTKDYDKRKGSGLFLWFVPVEQDFLTIFSLLSLYIASFIIISIPSKRRQSAGTFIPASIIMTSPTTKSWVFTLWESPYYPLIADTSSFLISSFNFRNYLAFMYSFEAVNTDINATAK